MYSPKLVGAGHILVAHCLLYLDGQLLANVGHHADNFLLFLCDRCFIFARKKLSFT